MPPSLIYALFIRISDISSFLCGGEGGSVRTVISIKGGWGALGRLFLNSSTCTIFAGMVDGGSVAGDSCRGCFLFKHMISVCAAHSNETRFERVSTTIDITLIKTPQPPIYLHLSVNDQFLNKFSYSNFSYKVLLALWIFFIWNVKSYSSGEKFY